MISFNYKSKENGLGSNIRPILGSFNLYMIPSDGKRLLPLKRNIIYPQRLFASFYFHFIIDLSACPEVSGWIESQNGRIRRHP